MTKYLLTLHKTVPGGVTATLVTARIPTPIDPEEDRATLSRVVASRWPGWRLVAAVPQLEEDAATHDAL